MLDPSEFERRLIMSQPMPGDHREVWEWLLKNKSRYPRNVFVPPFKRPSKPDKPRILAVCEFIVQESATLGIPNVLAIRYKDPWTECEIPLCGDTDDARRLADLLFRFRRRGWLTVFRYGNTRDFRVFAQKFIRGLLALGYRIQPINAGSDLIALKIRKGGHAWHLVDFEKATSIDPETLTDPCQSGTNARCACFKCLGSVLDVLHTIQDYLVSQFHVSLKATIGSAAIRAAAFHLPHALWKWRPHPLLVTMCRQAGGFRGGLISGRGYRGPSWMVDTNRLYTWAITRELPYRSALSPSVTNGILREGIYVVSIFGPGSFPIYVPVWRGPNNGFSVSLWRGDYVCSVLTTAEIDGIRALGYRVETGYGFQFVQTFNLATYVETLLRGVLDYGKSSIIGRITKAMGNSVYGKFAERPERIDAVFSVDRPGPNYFPFLDNNGDEIEDLWEHKHVRYNSHQHVEIAATITGYGRRHMYESIAAIRSSGGIIAATNTDSIITNIDPGTILQMDSTKIGKWRKVAYDSDGITVTRNAWAIGEHIALSGAPNKSRATIELLATGKGLALHGIRKAPFLRTGPISESYSFTYEPTANTADPDLMPTLRAPMCRETEASFDVLPARLPTPQVMQRETSPPRGLSPPYLLGDESAQNTLVQVGTIRGQQRLPP